MYRKGNSRKPCTTTTTTTTTDLDVVTGGTGGKETLHNDDNDVVVVVVRGWKSLLWQTQAVVAVGAGVVVVMKKLGSTSQ
jgi:hypothetical protein